MAKNDLQGALDLLILKTLSQLGSMHGYGIVMHIRRVSDERLIVGGVALSGPASHGAEWLDSRFVGSYRGWTKGKVLRVDTSREKASRR